MLNTRTGLLTVLLLVLTINVAENLAEEQLRPAQRSLDNAATLSNFENSPELFAGHERMHLAVVSVASAFYFGIFPALLVVLLISLARNQDLSRLRLFVLAIAIDYVISLVFFLAFPVPERWYYGESGATLLSNRLSYLFMRMLRPVSAIAHCFPSMHTSLAIIAVVTSFVYRLRYRLTVLAISLLILESTIILGIHWLADIVAGIGVGLLAFWVAWQLEERLKQAADRAPLGDPAEVRRVG
jgi:membrane-associated phospholipid phosphatase